MTYGWVYRDVIMISENLSGAQARLGDLIDAALNGEKVVICNHGVPVGELVPVRPVSREDPCREISELSVRAGQEALTPLGEDAWGD